MDFASFIGSGSAKNLKHVGIDIYLWAFSPLSNHAAQTTADNYSR